MDTQRKINPYLSMVRFFLCLVSIISLAGTAYFLVKAYQQWNFLANSSRITLQKKAYEYAQELDALLATIVKEAEVAALELSNTDTDRESILKKLWNASPLIGATGIAYAYTPSEKPFSLLITKKIGGTQSEFTSYHLEKYYDYTQ